MQLARSPAVVATGSTRMYSLMIDTETFMLHASSQMLPSFKGTGLAWKSTMLPMQLATVMGDRAMFELTMEKRTKTVWKWGGAALYEISLRGIDSSGKGGCDVMEICCEPDARPTTKALLRDDVFFGFLHKLVLKKWTLFGR